MKIKQLIICTCIGAFAPIYNLVAADTNINIQELGMFASPNELNSQLGPIKERIYNYDPTFSQQLESMSDENQLIAVRTWLAEKSFDFYYYEYMRMMQNASQETGHQIKTTAITQNVDNKGGWETIGTEFWLDSGDLDDAEKCYNLLERRACDYPAGFMEFRIKYIPDTEIEIFMDKPEQNARYQITIILNKNETSSIKDYYLLFSGQKYKYDEFHTWRNQERADIRAGKYIPATDADQPAPGSPFGDIAIKMDTSKQWKSQTSPSFEVLQSTNSWFNIGQ